MVWLSASNGNENKTTDLSVYTSNTVPTTDEAWMNDQLGVPWAVRLGKSGWRCSTFHLWDWSEVTDFSWFQPNSRDFVQVLSFSHFQNEELFGTFRRMKQILVRVAVSVVTQWFPLLRPVSRKSRDFREHFGWYSSLCIIQSQDVSKHEILHSF